MLVTVLDTQTAHQQCCCWQLSLIVLIAKSFESCSQEAKKTLSTVWRSSGSVLTVLTFDPEWLHHDPVATSAQQTAGSNIAPWCPPMLLMAPSPGGSGGGGGSNAKLPLLRPIPLLLGVSMHGCFRIPRMSQILYRAPAERETQQRAPDVFEVPTQIFLSGGCTRLNTYCGVTKGLKVKFGTSMWSCKKSEDSWDVLKWIFTRISFS